MVKNLNIEIEDNLHNQLKLNAVKKDINLKDYVIEILSKEVKK